MAPTVEQRRLNVLTAKKAALFGLLQQMYDLANAWEDEEKRERFARLCGARETTRRDLLRVVDEIIELKAEVDEKFVPNYDILSTVAEMCGVIETAEKRLQTPGTDERGAEVKGATPRLPKIDLPIFTGDVREWESFGSIFKSLIHDNNKLSDVDKLYYLLGCLRGGAKSVGVGIPLTGDNYPIVWRALQDRYQDKRVLANAYLEQLTGFKPLKETSEKGLNSFLERFDTAVRALKNLELPDLADFMLTSQALEKLGVEAARTFDLIRGSHGIPTYEEVIEFVKKRVKSLEATKSFGGIRDGDNRGRMVKTFVVGAGAPGCELCHEGDHGVARCDVFKGWDVKERYQKTQQNGWCYNCLSSRHGVRSCKSEIRCASCGKKHHSLLHGGHESNVGREVVTLSESANEEAKPMVLHAATYENPGSTVLLGTAVAKIYGAERITRQGRFLVDTGSQATLLTSAFCRQLGLSVTKTKATVQGLGGRKQPVIGATSFQMSSRFDPVRLHTVSALVLENLTGEVPQRRFQRDFLPPLVKLKLADENFDKPGRIDGVLGVDATVAILGKGHIKLGPGLPTALETDLGYVLMGGTGKSDEVSAMLVSAHENEPVEDLMRKFWEVEEIPESGLVQPQLNECEEHFLATYKRSEDGRFTVALPFKGDPGTLGDSQAMARRRFLALEKKLAQNPEIKGAYVNAMNDFIAQGHLQQVNGTQGGEELQYFIPHHAVWKPESSSTPVRIVFDASAPSTTGVSLNSILHEGPKLQLDIFRLLIGFRLFKVAITADLRQMYRQINVCKEHRKFQRLWWRENPEEELRVWELKPLAFGLTASPFLALRTVQQLLTEEKEFPETAALVKRGIYMDDLVLSVPEVSEAIRLSREMSEVFARGKFEVAKWASNEEQVLEKIPEVNRMGGEVQFKSDLKILGLVWDPASDVLKLRFPVPHVSCTKREILSSIARCFDPLGLAAPLILYMKVLMKELWLLKTGWDEEASGTIRTRWIKIRTEWSCLRDAEMKRYVGLQRDQEVSLFGFADASNNGYGAVVYCRTGEENELTLLCAKSRVAPVKPMTIPRLELCAAVLLTRLLGAAKGALEGDVRVKDMWAFSDSTIVLSWLHSSGHSESFVTNRVQKIREEGPELNWRHVLGKENPADCLSRGLTPKQLIETQLWWRGPKWLEEPVEEWPGEEYTTQRRIMCAQIPDIEENPLLALVERKSSWASILRVVVWVLRFAKRLPNRGSITVREIREAERRVIQATQEKHFPEDRGRVKAGKESTRRLRKLCPILQDELLRVGGRLENAPLRPDQQHPIILPKRCLVTSRIVDHYHKLHLHGGSQVLETILRQKYWILGGRTVVKGRIRQCHRCFRVSPKAVQPLMGNLPECRVTPSKAFLRTGVDYFGPLNITLARVRGAVTLKAYGCIFVCMAVKAVHLELVSSLASEQFVQAFRRFLARRGPCKELFSDRGTNFVGAKGMLHDMYRLLTSREHNENLQRALAEQEVEWNLNPAAAPHMGGLWEANIKSVKGHLRRVVGDQKLTYEELNTLLVQIEGVLNSRPLCVLSSEPERVEALTPAHFLTGPPLRLFPLQGESSETPGNRHLRDRFRLLEQMLQGFWKRWRTEYLTTLQVRQKWDRRRPNLEKGAVVVVRSDPAAPLQWPLGLVLETYPGSDGIVRVARVKCGNREVLRPVHKLCPLPSQ